MASTLTNIRKPMKRSRSFSGCIAQANRVFTIYVPPGTAIGLFSAGACKSQTMPVQEEETLPPSSGADAVSLGGGAAASKRVKRVRPRQHAGSMPQSCYGQPPNQEPSGDPTPTPAALCAEAQPHAQ